VGSFDFAQDKLWSWLASIKALERTLDGLFLLQERGDNRRITATFYLHPSLLFSREKLIAMILPRNVPVLGGERLAALAQRGLMLMSLFVRLMIVGWLTTFAMIGFCALAESGKLLKIRKRLAAWLEGPAIVVGTPDQDLPSEDQNVA
jgi:hypothetical protein